MLVRGGKIMTETDPYVFPGRLRRFLRLEKLPPVLRKLIVYSIGGLLLIAGMIMIVTPGPAFIVIPLALTVLGLESRWAETGSRKLFELYRRLRRKAAQPKPAAP